MAETVNALVAELEQLEQQARPGPWEWACDFQVGNAWHWNVHRTGHTQETICLGLVSIANAEWSIGHYPTPEMKLLVAARNAVPALTAEIRRLKNELETSRGGAK